MRRTNTISFSIYQPQATPVRAKNGRPLAVRIHGTWRQVTALQDRWRVDDGWWREETSRMYFELLLDDGQVVTIYQELTTGAWYQQRYGDELSPPPPCRALPRGRLSGRE